MSPPARGSAKKTKPKPKEPAYHLTPSIRDEHGEIIWPAAVDEIEKAREIIKNCANAQQKTLIVPDKDADGLTSGAILFKTLVTLGLRRDLIAVHLLSKSNTVHSDTERAAMALHNPSYIFVLDIGSRSSPPLIDAPHTGLIIDHHFALPTDFPEDSFHVNACNYPPVATSSLLTYEICTPLHPTITSETAWLAAIGTHGDLGAISWQPPFPDMSEVFAKHTKKAISDAVSLLNAPRRTAAYDVRSAWDALIAAPGPRDILASPRLRAARAQINAEVERCTHTPPLFSADADFALFKIRSPDQVHPLIATRWAAHLSSAKLRIVCVGNYGYLDGHVNFSCRIAKSARALEPRVDIIAFLKSAAERHESGTLRERLGEDFARGHIQASGGIVKVEEFEELMGVLGVGEGRKREEKTSPRKIVSLGNGQANKLTNYFAKAAG